MKYPQIVYVPIGLIKPGETEPFVWHVVRIINYSAKRHDYDQQTMPGSFANNDEANDEIRRLETRDMQSDVADHWRRK